MNFSCIFKRCELVSVMLMYVCNMCIYVYVYLYTDKSFIK